MSFPVTIDGVKRTLYTRWSEVSTRQGINYLMTLTDPPQTDRELIIWQQDIVFNFSDIPESYKGRLPLAVIRECFDTVMDLLKEPAKAEPISEFRFYEKLYKCADDAFDFDGSNRPMAQATVGELLEAMAIQEKIDSQRKEIQTVSGKISTGDMTLLPTMVAILYRPEGEPFDDAKVYKRALDFQNLPFETTLGCYSFFAERLNICISDMLRYSGEADKR